jgi:hypothetical protein
MDILPSQIVQSQLQVQVINHPILALAVLQFNAQELHKRDLDVKIELPIVVADVIYINN